MNSDMEYETLETSGSFGASIRDFRSAVTHIAERETAEPVAANWLASAQKRHRIARQRMALGWASAALLCFATLPLSLHPRHAVVTPVVKVVVTPAPEADTALLDQVDTNLSESVPSSLAPLAELDNWNSASANTSGDSSSGTLTKTEKNNVAH
jgi:hypothetical protein